MAHDQLNRRAGQARPRERTLWVIGNTVADFEHARPVLEKLADGNVRLEIMLSTAKPGIAGKVRQTFPAYGHATLPHRNPFSISRFLSNGNIRTVLLLGTPARATRRLLSGIARRAIPLVCHGSDDNADALADAPDAAFTDADKPEDIAAHIQAMMGRDLKEKREERSALIKTCQRLIARARMPGHDGWLTRRIHEFQTPRALNQALGNPDTIMCLGNGPSSEDPRLAGLAHDALFRVNHIWTHRGMLTQADVVFTGGKPTMRAVRTAIIGVQNDAAAARLIATRLFAPSLRPIRFVNVTILNHRLNGFDWGPHRPTNGAAMLAAAISLQPKKLIVAGIDLFQHPGGAYPGDAATPNEFSPAHALDAELDFLLELFDSYRGELVIVSDVLGERWRAHKQGAPVKRAR